MAAEAVKLPLAVKKAIRDLEPKQIAALAKATALAGFPADVSFSYDIDAAWAAMEGHKDQAKLPNVVIESYLPKAVGAIVRAWKDDIVSAAFLNAFTAKKITLTIVPADHVEPKTANASWNGYNGLRLIDGALDIYFKKSGFWTNVNNLENIKLAEVMCNLPGGGLPLAILVKIRDGKADREAMLARCAKALGIDALTCDVEADFTQILAAAPAKADINAYNLYLKALAGCLERKCADDMVKEAVLGVMGSKKVSLRVVADMKAVSGLKIDNLYNGIQFDGGVLTMITTEKNFFCNVPKIEQLDIITLF